MNNKSFWRPRQTFSFVFLLENKAEKRYWYSGSGFICQQTLEVAFLERRNLFHAVFYCYPFG